MPCARILLSQLTMNERGCVRPSSYEQKMLKIKQKLVALEMERCQRKLSTKIVSRLTKIKEQKEIFESCCKRLRRNAWNYWFTSSYFLLVLIVSSTANVLCPFCPHLWCKFFGDCDWSLLPNTDSHLNTELFWHWLLGLAFRESEEADITAILKHWRIIVLSHFPVIFISTLSLGGLAHLLWLSLPLALFGC